MAQFGETVLTKKGLLLEAKVHAGTKLEFTKAKVGDGILDDIDRIFDMTDLISFKKEFPINSVTANAGKTSATVEVIINNKNIDEGFILREVGIYANDPDEGEILYAVRNSGVQGDYLPEASVSHVDLIMSLTMAVGNAENVLIQYDDSLLFVTMELFKKLAGKNWSTENVVQNAKDIAAIRDGTIPLALIGNLTDLSTNDKSSVVAAINEVNNKSVDLAQSLKVGSGTFAGDGAEVTIAHGLPAAPKFVDVRASANPGGFLGEVWVRFDATNIYVGNSGSFKGRFAYLIYV
ncbi:MAG: phage tail protein [Peptostreptococcaceae bacterium]|nr:phage tail protein [Peptostreptococcaceae bacterium]